MAHDSYEEDIELANGHPVGSSRNTPNMAERTLLHISEERDKYKEALKRIYNTGYSQADPGCRASWYFDMRDLAEIALYGKSGD